MKRFTIHTKNYKTKLINFTQIVLERNLCTIETNHSTKCTDIHSIKFIWALSAGKEFIQALMLLLYDIAIQENPVYRHSPKLSDLAEGLQNTHLHIHDTRRLKAFIQANKELHLDGYVAFRMEEYREKLDMMLYTIIKKINLSK